MDALCFKVVAYLNVFELRLGCNQQLTSAVNTFELCNLKSHHIQSYPIFDSATVTILCTEEITSSYDMCIMICL